MITLSSSLKEILNFQQEDFIFLLKLTSFYIVKLALTVAEFTRWMFILRFTMAWFPNINPFIQPFYTIYYYCGIFVNDLKDKVPLILGIDIVPIVFFELLQFAIKLLKNFDHSLTDSITNM